MLLLLYYILLFPQNMTLPNSDMDRISPRAAAILYYYIIHETKDILYRYPSIL